MNLTVIILTYNEEVNLPACLESLKGLDCEVFVVDSGSTDRTVQIAEAAGASVVEHPFDNYAVQRNWAQKHLPIQGEWLLHLDADERLTPKLVTEIRETLGLRSKELGVRREALGVGRDGQERRNGEKSQTNETNPTNPKGLEEVDGFLLRKRTVFMGRWIKHGGHYPSYHLRLFRRGHGFCENRLYDQHFLVNGRIRPLNHDYIDVITSDLSTWTLRHTRWAELETQELTASSNGSHRVQLALLGNPIERRRWLRVKLYARSPLFVRALLYWFYRYVIRLGFLDGKEGLIFHFLQGFWYRFLIDAKIYEARKKRVREKARGERSQE